MSCIERVQEIYEQFVIFPTSLNDRVFRFFVSHADYPLGVFVFNPLYPVFPIFANYSSAPPPTFS